MPVIVEDNFELHTVGQPPIAPWTVTAAGGGGSVTVENDPAAGASRGKVLRLLEGVGAGATSSFNEAVLPIPGSSCADRLVFMFDVYPLQATKKLYIGVIAGGIRYPLFSLFSDGTMRYFNSSSVWTALTTATTYTSGSWKKWRIILDRTLTSAEIVRIYDMVAVAGSQGVDLNTVNIPTAIQAVYFATDSTEDNSTFYISDPQVLERFCAVSGVVYDQRKNPVAGARVVLTIHRADHLKIAEALTDSRGIFTITGQTPGADHIVTAYHPSLSNYGAAVMPYFYVY